MQDFTIIAEFTVKPEDADRFRVLSEAVSRASAQEPGCLRYDVLDQRAPGSFLFYEVYGDEAAFKTHLSQAHTQSFLAAAKPMIVTQSVNRLASRPAPPPRTSEPGSVEVAERLRELNTSVVADVLRPHAPERLVMRGVSAVTAHGQVVVGRARTLRYLPARADIKPSGDHRRVLIDTVGAGDVLVFDGSAVSDFPLFGDMTALRAMQNKAAGCVTDGLVRDVTAIEEIGLPVFARGTWPAPSASFPVAWEMDTPVQCGGVAVMPGDWIMGDADGVIVIPPGLVEEILGKAPMMLKKEEFASQLLMRGHSLFKCYPVPQALLPLFERWAAGGALPTDEDMRSL